MPSTNRPSLPTNRAFVVQLHADAHLEHGEFRGRVEHVVSMRATQFHSLEELAAFIVQVVTTLPADDAEPLPARDEKPGCLIRESP
jgi:hypothetical protein